MQSTMMLAIMSVSSCLVILISMFLIGKGGPITRSARQLYGRKWGVALLVLGALEFAGLWSMLDKTGSLAESRQQLTSAILLYTLVVVYLQVFQFWAVCHGIRIAKFCTHLLLLACLKTLSAFSYLLRSSAKLLNRAFRFAIYQPAIELYGAMLDDNAASWFAGLVLSCIPWGLSELSGYLHITRYIPVMFVLLPALVKLLKQPGCGISVSANHEHIENELYARATYHP